MQARTLLIEDEIKQFGHHYSKIENRLFLTMAVMKLYSPEKEMNINQIIS